MNGYRNEFSAVPLLVFPWKVKQLFQLKVQGAPTTKVCSIFALPLLVFPGKLKQLFRLKVQGAPTTKICSILNASEVGELLLKNEYRLMILWALVANPTSTSILYPDCLKIL